MERWEIISGELEADLSRPLERLGFGRVFISDHRTASQLIFQREAARTVPKCAFEPSKVSNTPFVPVPGLAYVGWWVPP